MPRYALHSTIREGEIENYIREHERIPQDLRLLFDRVGIREWVIWRSGNRLFHMVEADDLTQSLRLVGQDPADAAWQANIGRFVDDFFDSDGKPNFGELHEVWSLSGQRR